MVLDFLSIRALIQPVVQVDGQVDLCGVRILVYLDDVGMMELPEIVLLVVKVPHALLEFALFLLQLQVPRILLVDVFR